MKVWLIALVLCAGAFAACGDDDDGGNGEGGDDDPQAVLSEAATRFEALTSFHFDLRHNKDGTEIVQGLLMKEASGEIEEPDRLRADLTAEGPGGIDIDVSAISIGERVWLTNPFSGDYEELSGVSVLEIFDPAQGIPNVAGHIDGATIAGREEIGGEEAVIVEGTVASEYLEGIAPIADAGSDVNVRVWIGRESDLIHRVIVSGKIASEDAEDIERTIELSRFDEDFGIAEPD